MTKGLKSILSGVGFGFTSGVITTLGLILGLNASTDSKLAVIGGILTIAFADAMSDSLGMHVSKESEGDVKSNNIWLASISTFLTKLICALSFVVPFIFFEIEGAVKFSVGWGLFLLVVSSYSLAKETKEKPWDVIKEHLTISIIVLIAAQIIGTLVKKYFV